MNALLRAELLKLRTTRTFVALVSAAVGISLLLTTLVAAIDEPTQETVLEDVFQSDTSGLFILILAIVGISGEWRHKTITSSLLAAPHRVKFLAAKTLAFATAGLALSLAVSVAVSAAGYLILSGRNLPTPDLGEVLGLWGLNAIVAALLAALGVGIGALVRNQVGAIVGVLVFMFVVAPILASVAPDVARYEPTSALPATIADIDPSQNRVDGIDPIAPGAAVVVMLVWITAAFGTGAALLRSRDLQ